MKRYLLPVAVLCLANFALQAEETQKNVQNSPVIGHQRIEPKKRGFELQINYNVLSMPMGAMNDFVNKTSFSISANVLYQFKSHWKVGIGMNSGSWYRSAGEKTFYSPDSSDGSIVSMTGTTSNYLEMFSIGGVFEYNYPVSRFCIPYAGLHIDGARFQQSTDIGDMAIEYSDDRWALGLSPEVGVRSFFDRNQSIGANLSFRYNYYTYKNRGQLVEMPSEQNPYPASNININGASLFNISLGLMLKF